MRLLHNYTLHVQANHNRVYIYMSLFITQTAENKNSAATHIYILKQQRTNLMDGKRKI
jgi:hypothetical protein